MGKQASTAVVGKVGATDRWGVLAEALRLTLEVLPTLYMRAAAVEVLGVLAVTLMETVAEAAVVAFLETHLGLLQHTGRVAPVVVVGRMVQQVKVSPVAKQVA